MCTALSYLEHNHYFGRNLDLDFSYNESVAILPRNYPLHFRHTGSINTHYAMIGMATNDNGYPLYYDATNEHGLSIAGLNFPEYAFYPALTDCAVNIAPFELIPWILAQCKTVDDAIIMLKKVRICAIPYNDSFPLTPLHWILCDRHRSIVLEPLQDGLKIFENPIGVLTNSPPFDFHIQNLRQYLCLTSSVPEDRFTKNKSLAPFSRGAGAFGLPGDNSSSSRFVRAAFTKLNSVCKQSESSCVCQFFHILQSVAQIRGTVEVADKHEITVYSSCCNTDLGIYYYTTYENSQITAVHLQHENLDGKQLINYPLILKAQIANQN